MAIQTARYDIQDGLYIYKQSNSKRWYARFVLDGNWYSKATKATDKDSASQRAIELLAEYRIKVEHGIPIKRTKRARKYRFTTIADLAIERMNSDLESGTGKVAFTNYIQALENYHKIFFADNSIYEIDHALLPKFDSWRVEKLGHIPSKSTVLRHNAALNKVFDEAVIRKYLNASQVPTLANTGTDSERRASFTESEYATLLQAASDFARQAKTEKSKAIRELLCEYIEIAANTGIRPGTEMENITWADVSIGRENEVMFLYITVRKGKTTSSTGTRKVVCRDEAQLAFLNLRDMFPDRKPGDRIFVLDDGRSTKQLSFAFQQLLKKTGMDRCSEGKRSLYSLRHSYITWQLKRKISAQVLALQCGTSVQMLEKFYSHVVPEMFTEELAGVQLSSDSRELLPKPLDPIDDADVIEMVNEYIDEWEAEYTERGCI